MTLIGGTTMTASDCVAYRSDVIGYDYETERLDPLFLLSRNSVLPIEITRISDKGRHTLVIKKDQWRKLGRRLFHVSEDTQRLNWDLEYIACNCRAALRDIK
jgi:hypothetical protein